MLVLAAGGLPLAVVGLTGNEGTRTETTAVSATFNPQRGRTFEQPELPRLCGGLLKATLTGAQGADNVAGAEVRGKSYQGTFIGPTLRVRPGDTLEIRLVNRLGEPTNLHEHGFHVSPIGISDNVLRTMPAGSDNAIRVALPRNLSPGTYWYHSHLHGLVEEQISPGWQASSWLTD